MRLTLVACILAILTTTLQSVQSAAKTVGLHAPDRYDGIPDMCLMPMDFGYCRAKVKRYYFDMRRMKCNMFYWGGCAGNSNNFKSLEECNEICADAIDIQNNHLTSNVKTPTTTTAITGRNKPTPPVAKKIQSNLQNSFATKTNTATLNANSNIGNIGSRISHTNSNSNNNLSNINTSLYANQNFNKYKINRNFNVPKNDKDVSEEEHDEVEADSEPEDENDYDVEN